jgi:RNA polymerase sigma-70 factor, ECF subfamily
MALSAGDPLARSLAEGRPEAISAIYDRFGLTLFRLACSMVGSPADAEDAVQEVFVGLVRGRARLGQIANLRAFLFTALRRAALRLAEQRQKERATPAAAFLELAAPSPRTMAVERAEQLERALRTLPVEQRELIALKIDGELTFAEIAEVLGISPNTAASRYRYALEKLRAMLEPLNDEAR